MAEKKAKKLRVGVIFGGRSAEHEVSLVSARAVLASLDPQKYDVSLIGITREGRWLPLGEVSGEQLAQAKVEPAALMAPYIDPVQSAQATHTAVLPDPAMRGLPEIKAAAGASYATSTRAALSLLAEE